MKQAAGDKFEKSFPERGEECVCVCARVRVRVLGVQHAWRPDWTLTRRPDAQPAAARSVWEAGATEQSPHREFNHSEKLAPEVWAWTTLDFGYS